MKHLSLLLAILVFATTNVIAQNSKQDLGLPQLHTISTVTLSPSYSCRSTADFQQGYGQTALFLSADSKRSDPDLLFNGACKADDEFRASISGDDFSLIADLGANVPIEEVSASKAFNLKRVNSYAEYSKFVDTVKVILNHTYVVLLNTRDKRGLFVFTVDEYIPNRKVVLRYAVKSYDIMSRQIRSEGFDWSRANN